MKHGELFSQEEQNELKQLKIEEKDERNVALGNAAKARAYELMMWLYTISISLLAFFHIISLIAFFILLGVYVICQIYAEPVNGQDERRIRAAVDSPARLCW